MCSFASSKAGVLLNYSRRVNRAQVEKLEQKVEDLVTLLTSNHGAKSTASELQKLSRNEDRLPNSTFQDEQSYHYGMC